MDTNIQDIIALQIGRLMLKNITDEFEKNELKKIVKKLSEKQNEYSINLDENGIEIK
jgi:hypothetical protein